MQAIHILQASYIRERVSARDTPALDLARVRDPAERGSRIQHGFLFLSPSPSVVVLRSRSLQPTISYARAVQDKYSSNK